LELASRGNRREGSPLPVVEGRGDRGEFGAEKFRRALAEVSQDLVVLPVASPLA
jgi:hypothetical protein